MPPVVDSSPEAAATAGACRTRVRRGSRPTSAAVGGRHRIGQVADIGGGRGSLASVGLGEPAGHMLVAFGEVSIAITAAVGWHTCCCSGCKLSCHPWVAEEATAAIGQAMLPGLWASPVPALTELVELAWRHRHLSRAASTR